MKSLIIKKYGDFNSTEVMDLISDHPKPTLNPNSSDILVKILACGLNPGDCRVLSGDVSLIMRPSAFPFVPGMDICGQIEEVGAKCTQFKVGDRIVAGFPPLVYAGFAEYVVMDSKLAVSMPTSLSPLEAATLPIAGLTALKVMTVGGVKEGTKMLILGASGGVGTYILQMAKHAGASFIAATSTNEDLVKSLGAHQVIDYRKDAWWEVLKGKELDIVVDCVGNKESWTQCGSALSSNGKYLTLVGDNPESKVKNVIDLVQFAAPVLGRSLWPMGPSYKMIAAFANGPELQKLVDLVNQGALKPILDPNSPFEFTLEGIKKAMTLQSSHRAKGKLVVSICDQ
jgi:2-desacetyl-2-hydroxyethyl bacteriochlorophyllide A dehydrogenase